MDFAIFLASGMFAAHQQFDQLFPNQLYTATLDNTGNNNTTCRTIADIHIRRDLDLPKWDSSEQQLP